jgi:phospholipid/cholesterol/gamma-HCH transport system permease protein
MNTLSHSLPEHGLPPAAAGTLGFRGEGDLLVLILVGRFDAESTGPLWRKAFALLDEKKPARLVIDATGVDYCDGAGIGLIVELRRRGGHETEVRGLAAPFRSLLDLFPIEPGAPPPPKPAPASLPVDLGRWTWNLLKDLRAQISFIGQILIEFVRAFRHPTQIRWRDALRVAEVAGVEAVPIAGMMGFLIGVILAFESAAPLKEFGSKIYVADLVAISIVRELGPLLSAILVAGRSGSAFAAELGTMKVNEEIDALTTMGLGSVRFLVVPRVLAAIFVTPLLTIYFSAIALVGAGVVVMSFGYSLATYRIHVLQALTVAPIFGGLLKSLVFGLIIAGVGCQRGLSAGKGALAVGISTTGAVVAGILLTVVVDGVFSVVRYALGV